jgi:hypothetical protein
MAASLSYYSVILFLDLFWCVLMNKMHSLVKDYGSVNVYLLMTLQNTRKAKHKLEHISEVGLNRVAYHSMETISSLHFPMQ